MSRDPHNDWAVIIPSMGDKFHRVNSLDMLYNLDTVIGYGLDRDKSWILYILLSEMGMESVMNMPLNEVMEIVKEIKELSWLDASKMVEQLKAEGHQ
jgi:hypothetical protein